LRSVDSAGVENCHFPLTKPVAVNIGLALYRAARDNNVIVERGLLFVAVVCGVVSWASAADVDIVG